MDAGRSVTLCVWGGVGVRVCVGGGGWVAGGGGGSMLGGGWAVVCWLEL